ncbi:MAG: 4'-phosphopantetheinyl transferase superfamily protein [Bradymonadales bacterium]|nr:4'-phosphopantetheinyl transferase superfamily protein [Bradymonadales bacterium]
MAAPLSPHTADLWYLCTGDVNEPALLAAYLDLLSPEERVRHDRFLFAKDRHLFLVSRALLRITLSRYAAVNPSDWVFGSRPGGKPEIEQPRLEPPLHFSLSHTAGLAALLVTTSERAGLDVEAPQSNRRILQIARYAFSPDEVEEIEKMDQETQQRRFYEYWTLKEAYLKARGLGLSLPMSGLSFRMNAEGVSATFSPQLEDDPSHWQFTLLRLADRYQAAIAIHRQPDLPPVTIRLERAVPRWPHPP